MCLQKYHNKSVNIAAYDLKYDDDRRQNERLSHNFCAYGVSKFMFVILKCENISFIPLTLERSLMPIACLLNLFNTFIIQSERKL